MTIEIEDLDAAVAAGIIPQAQADALRAFVAERHRSIFEQGGQEDERFRFMTGFNDFFFAIGILLLGFGMMFLTGGASVLSLVAAILVWALAELLVRRMRLVLPGILLALFFLMFVFLAVPTNLLTWSTAPGQPMAGNKLLAAFGFSAWPLFAMTKALIGTFAASLYYWRFRLPFALLPIAGSLVLVFTSLGSWLAMTFGVMPQDVSLFIILISGLALFTVAIAFDMSDRDRITRRSDCAFWLHLLAAPLIVHSLISLFAPNIAQMTNGTAAIIVLIVVILAVVAITIDRRALLVSALAYIGVVIAYAIGGPNVWSGNASQARGAIFFMTLVILGSLVITLGVAWQPLRRRLIASVSPSLARRLPPVPGRA